MRPLSDHLPAIPKRRQGASLSRDERAEYMLLEIMRAPLEYQRAAALVARAGENLRACGEEVYEEGLVHFTLSRSVEAADGTVPLERLRDLLCDQSFVKVILPALMRLHANGFGLGNAFGALSASLATH